MRSALWPRNPPSVSHARATGTHAHDHFTVGLLATLAVAPSAFAATASIPDPADDNGRSFSGPVTDVANLGVTWNGQALTVTATYNSIRSASLNLLVSDSPNSPDPSDAPIEDCNPQMADSLTVVVDGGTATLEMPDIDGALTAPAAWNGTSVSYTFTSPTLTKALGDGSDPNLDRDPFTCASGDADGDSFVGGFAGKVLRLTPEIATASLKARLAQDFGAAFTNSPDKWVKCPERRRSCPRPRRWRPSRSAGMSSAGPARTASRARAVSVPLISGRVTDQIEDLKSRPYRKRVRACPIASRKGGWVNGTSLTNRKLRASESLGKGKACRSLVGGAGMAQDLHSSLAALGKVDRTVSFHGTNMAGFADIALFRCQVDRSGNHYSFDCRNRRHDRFVYSFTVNRKTAHAR